MKDGWKYAVAGGFGGAVLSLALVFGAARSGLLPASGPSIRDYLMAHPEILVDMTNQLQSDEQNDADAARQAAVDKLGPKVFFDSNLAFITGPANAKDTLVEFYDYDCPYCRASLPAVKKFYEMHKRNTRFAFIELPIPSLHGPGAVLAARASLAARRQPDKFVAFHFTLMGEDGAITEDAIYAAARKVGLDVAKLKADMADSSVDLAVARAHTLAEAAKVDGTPAFIINGKIREGALDDKSLAKMTNAPT
ncbi:MAG TPA: thioredoxin domain-containing protein [Rhizomicrobium sp.]|nr:thioredoxin domain-containing protein [Rhizomicrobium sp.]